MRWLLIAWVFSLAGCPRETGMPDPSEDARPCMVVEDCNEGRSCGELSACVDGLCEAEMSLEVPCR